jgi:hypothetical protein
VNSLAVFDRQHTLLDPSRWAFVEYRIFRLPLQAIRPAPLRHLLTSFPVICLPLQLPPPLPLLPAVCPRGFFESDSSAQSCTRCPANQYCPGGDKVENPTNRGGNTTCGDNLVTRNTGARSQSDCLAPAGYARTSPTTATACATSEYAPQFNRLSKCLRCQSGLAEDPALDLAVSARATKKAVCSEWSCR